MSHIRAAAFVVATLAGIALSVPLQAQNNRPTEPKQLWEIKEATRFQRIALSPDGKWLAYTRNELGPERFKTQLRLCEARTGKELHLLAFAGRNQGETPVDARNPNRPAVPGGAMMAQMLSLEIVTALSFSADGKTLATLSNGFGSSEVFLKLWDVGSGKQQKQFSLSMALGQGLAYLPDGRLLAAGMSSKMSPYLKIVETKQGKAVADLMPELQVRLNKYYPRQPLLTSFELAGDGRTLVLGIGDMQTSYVHLYDMKTQKLDFNIAQLANNRAFTAATLAPDGKTVAVTRNNAQFAGFGVGQGAIGKAPGGPAQQPEQGGTTIELIDRATKRKRATISIADADANGFGMLGDVPFRFTADSLYLVTGGDSAGRVRIWDAQTGTAVGEHRTGLKRVTAMAMGPNLLVTGSDSVNAIVGVVGVFGGQGMIGGAPGLPPGAKAPPQGLDPSQPPPTAIPPFILPFQPGQPPLDGKPGAAPLGPIPGGIGGGFGGFQMPAPEAALKVWDWSSMAPSSRSSSMKN
jgi:WD40 repeat protein